MNFSLQKPPIYERLKARFGVSWDKGIAITYGDTVYSKYPIDKILASHEEVHVWQQAQMGVEEWWNLYLNNDNFRLNQEVQAYKRQIEAIKTFIKDKNQAFLAIRKIYLDLSSDMYGNICNFDQAKQLLST